MTQDLIDGVKSFKHYHYEGDHELMADLVKEGQDPKYFIISCIDSRCNPGTIFRAQPGIFFAHKAMGAIVRPYHQGTALAAALQFALNYNNVTTVIVLGHTQCGAIQALANDIDDPEISSFISVARHGLEKAKACCTNHNEILSKTEKEVILESTENLKSYPSVAKALAENRVKIKSWQFNMKTGDLLEYSDKTKKFEILTTNTTTAEDSRKNNEEIA
ncbi:MAG: carbonic anhydrase [Alphaproteobacteria bacterium]|nr:carbonic anhydrase [Alphaproteobacteria bacterium]